MIVAESVALSQSIKASAVTPVIAPIFTPLLSLGLILVVATIGRMKVTVSSVTIRRVCLSPQRGVRPRRKQSSWKHINLVL